ncbi:MAG: endonuclease/exonuclease/phosphatase family protein [Oligoflexia bacterium]|nr:endonuclease/exonuclease/phosphatase family protein [Oligoflexia bacterium]
MKNTVFILGLIMMGFLMSLSAKSADCTNIYPPNSPFYEANYQDRLPLPKSTFKFVSYNVGLFENFDKILNDLSTIDSIKNADVILLQEAAGDMGGPNNKVDELARALKMNYVFAPAMTLWEKDYGNAILTKWPIAQYQKVLLPFSDKENCNQRISLMVTLDVNGKRVVLSSVHLSTRFSDSIFGSDRSRSEQLKPAIAAMSKSGSDYLLFSGDLNTFKGSGYDYIVDMASEHGFSDVHLTPGWTFRKYSFNLDHIFAKGFRHLQDGTERSAEGSDHVPVWSILSF